MPPNRRPTSTKRFRERARQEKQEKKEQRRLKRLADKAAGITTSEPEEVLDDEPLDAEGDSTSDSSGDGGD